RNPLTHNHRRHNAGEVLDLGLATVQRPGSRDRALSAKRTSSAMRVVGLLPLVFTRWAGMVPFHTREAIALRARAMRVQTTARTTAKRTAFQKRIRRARAKQQPRPIASPAHHSM